MPDAPLPTPVARDRLRHLDLLRGVAVLGILPVNIVFFALPMTASADPAYVSGGGWHEQVSFYTVRVFFEYKFITLFSFLFGAGMMILRERAEGPRRSSPRIHQSRIQSCILLLLLLMIGG